MHVSSSTNHSCATVNWYVNKWCFPTFSTFGNFHEKVHRVKNVFHQTQVLLVYAPVTKIQDGGTDIAVNSLELVIHCENSQMEHALTQFPTQKQDYLFKIPLLFRNFLVEIPENVCSINIPTGISRISVYMERAQDGLQEWSYLTFLR